jgi:large subunit ribosomal protein L25
METDVLKVSPREPKGSKAAARVRRAEAVPGVLYGGGKETMHLAVPLEPFEQLLRRHKRVLTLQIGSSSALALLKEVQHDALGDTVLHIDFLRVDETKQIKVKVPLEFVGHPKGLSNNGEFVHPMNEIEVECLPIAIPEAIRVKVDHLDVGMQITAKELTIPQGVKMLSSPDSIVCTVHMKGLEPEPVAAAAEAGPAEPERITKPVATEEGETPEGAAPKAPEKEKK